MVALAMAMAIPFISSAENPDMLNVEEERWEIHYNLYQALLNNDPQYLDLSHEVTIKRDAGRIYIRGIFEEYPDAWVTGSYTDSCIYLTRDQNLSPESETPAYFQRGTSKLTGTSKTDREYTISVEFNPAHTLWCFGYEGDNQNLLVPKLKNSAVWISDKQRGAISLNRTYYFDGTSTGDDFDPQPIYLHPTFRKVTESGIMDAVTDRQQPEDTRVFDLSGRQVNPDRLTPGIYIRAGRKFIVR